MRCSCRRGLSLLGGRCAARCNVELEGRVAGRPTPVPITELVLALLGDVGRPQDVGRLFRLIAGELHRERAAMGLPTLRAHDMRRTVTQGLEDAGEGETNTDALHHSTPAPRAGAGSERFEGASFPTDDGTPAL